MLKSRLKVAGDDQASEVLIKQEVVWLGEDTDAPDLANQIRQDPLSSPQIDENSKTELVPNKEFKDNDLVTGRTSEKKSETSNLPAKSDAPVKLRRGPKPRPKCEQVWQCEICMRVIKKKYDLKKHLLTHAKFKAFFVCEICGSSFTEKGSRNKHMRRKHSDKADPQATGDNPTSTNQILKNPQTDSQTTFECEICSRSCKTKSNLKKHLHTHAEDRERKFACDLCDQKFYSRNALWCHKKVHTRNLYTCKVCERRFGKEERLKVHILRNEHFDETQSFTPQTSNDDGRPMKTELLSDEEFIDEGNEGDSVSNVERSFQPTLAADDDQRIRVAVTCEICQNSYPEELIETHKRITHEKRYKCEFCPQSCKTKCTLKMHLETHSTDRKREFACDLCNKKFYTKNILWSHKKTHEELRTRVCKREFACDFCEKRFEDNCGLKRHRNIHTKESSFTCEVCGASYMEKGRLNNHMRSKHLGEGQSTFICEVCESSFTTNGSLKRHMLTKHSVTPGPQTAKGGKFENSGSCKTGSILKVYLNVDEAGNREFACDLCKKKFSNSHFLWSHKKKHRCGKDRENRLTAKGSIKVHEPPRPHLDITPEFTPQTSNQNAVRTTPELLSEEEFIDEENDRGSVFHAE